MPVTNGGSMHGITVSADGRNVYVTATGSMLLEATVGADGALAWRQQLHLSKRESYPCGIVLLPPNRAVVCLSIANSVAIVNLDEPARVTAEIPVGVAPYDLAISADGKTAFVSN